MKTQSSIEVAETTASEPVAVDSMEIEVEVSDPKKKRRILKWLAGFHTTPTESAQDTRESVGNITDYSVNEVSKAWQKTFRLSQNNLGSGCELPNSI